MPRRVGRQALLLDRSGQNHAAGVIHSLDELFFQLVQRAETI